MGERSRRSSFFPLFLIALIAPLGCAGTPLSASEVEGFGEQGLRLTVMSFNLRASGLDKGENAWYLRSDAAASVINEIGPTIVATQEGDRLMIDDLRRRTVAPYAWIGSNRETRLPGIYKTAILYRTDILEIVEAGQFWLSETPDVSGSVYPGTNHSRLCEWVRFGVRGQESEFWVYNTHLDHRSQPAREYGAELVQRRILEQLEHLNLPVIVTGDMNARPGNEAIRRLRYLDSGEAFLLDAADWARARGAQVGATSHGFRGTTNGSPIDHIFHTAEWQVTGYGIYTDPVNGRYPSDHYPVWATLTIKE